MTDGGPLLLNLILYLPYYNALLFASMEELDHKKPVASKINLHFDNCWTAFTDEPHHSYFDILELLVSCPSLSFLSAVFVPNVLARRTSLSPVCGKTHLCPSLILPISFGLILHSTATRAENKMPIRLEAICSLWYRRHLVVSAENCSVPWNPAYTKGGPADGLYNTSCSLHGGSQQLSASFNWETRPVRNKSKARSLTHTHSANSLTSKNTCNRHLKYFTRMRRCSGPWFF